MRIRIGNLTIRITFLFAVFLAVAANIAGGRNVLLSFLFSFLHEAVHLIFLYLSGIKKAELVFLPGGIKIICNGLSGLSYKKTALCALAAPVFNVFAGASFYVLYIFLEDEILFFCCVINFVSGLINLMPMRFLDGGRAAEAFLLRRLDEENAVKIMVRLSVLSVIALFSMFFVGCIMGKIQIFLLIFSIYCFIGVFSDKEYKK